MSDVTFTMVLKPGLAKRLEDAQAESPFATRLEFIRYLLDAALTDWEHHNGH